MTKTKQWVNKNVDLQILPKKILNFLTEHGFEDLTLYQKPYESNSLIVAKKEMGFFKRNFAPEPTLEISITGNSNDFKIQLKGITSLGSSSLANKWRIQDQYAVFVYKFFKYIDSIIKSMESR